MYNEPLSHSLPRHFTCARISWWMVLINFSVYLFSKSAHILTSVNSEAICQWYSNWPVTLTHLVTFSCFPENSVGFSNLFLFCISTLYLYSWYHGIMCNRNSRRFYFIYRCNNTHIWDNRPRVNCIISRSCFQHWEHKCGEHIIILDKACINRYRKADNLAIYKNTCSLWAERSFGCFKSNITYISKFSVWSTNYRVQWLNTVSHLWWRQSTFTKMYCVLKKVLITLLSFHRNMI